MAASLRISVLGELEVLRDGQSVPLPPSRKTRALLGFLALATRPQRREQLCEMLWDLPDDPRAALRWSLSKIRRVLDDAVMNRVVADRDRASLQIDDGEVDLRAMRNALQPASPDPGLPALQAMADALGRPLLDGLDLPSNDLWQVWLAAEREKAARLRRAVLDRIAQRADGSAAAPSMRNMTAAAQRQAIGFCTAACGTRIAYATVGAGPPIVKTANWLNHLDLDWQSPIWSRTFQALAAQRTLIRYDERGNGLSDWDVPEISFEAFVRDLETVADTLGLGRFPLLGMSQGCAVSVEYAVRHPERVSALILIGGYAAGWRIGASAEERERREATMTLTRLGWGTGNAAYRHIFSQTFMPDGTAEDLAWFDEFQRRTTSAENAVRFQDAFGDIDVRDRLALVRAPTLVLHARGDQRISLAQGRELAIGIPGARFAALDSRSHIILDHEPAWPVLMDEIERFLAEQGV